MTAAYCALSLLVGVLIGAILRDAVDLLRASRKEPCMSNDERSTLGRRVMLALVSIVVATNCATGVLLAVTRHNAAKYAECSAHWEQSWAKAYRARYNPAVKVSKAMDAVVNAVANKDSAGFDRAVANYVRLRVDQNQSRATHPLPPVPADVCGPASDAAQ
jgi:hypothetical protein